MASATDLETGLAYDMEGAGTPVVFVHGLTFDRRTWRPIIDQLDGSVTSIAIDLPAHGDSGGEPAPLESVIEQVRRLLEELDVERPVVVGHSIAGVIATVSYARRHGLRVAAQGTGHAAAPLGPLDGTVLVKISRPQKVSIDPVARIARAESGAVWADVVGPAAGYGLAGLAGTELQMTHLKGTT